jgi:Zn-dependent protease with chaperone function
VRTAGTLVAAGAWVGAAALLWRTHVPADLRLPPLDPHQVFGAETVRRARRHDAFLRLDWLVELVFELGLLGALALLGPRLAARLRGAAIVRGASLAALAWILVWVVRFPFGLAAEWWERRSGLSRQSYGAWLVDRLPSPLELVAVVAAVAVGMALARRLGPRWWIAAAPALALAGLVFALVQPLLGPTLHPLRSAALLPEIRRAGIEAGVDRVAKKTRVANAEALGIGPTRRVIFDDTLLDGRFSVAALRVVGAHELAHHSRRHIWKGVAWFALFSLPCAFVLAWATERSGGLARPGTVPLALLVALGLQILSVPIGGAIARRYESEADWTALERTRDSAGAQALFTGFAHANLEDPSPPGWAQLVLDDHPSLLERVEQARAWSSRATGAAGSPAGSGSLRASTTSTRRPASRPRAPS